MHGLVHKQNQKVWYIDPKVFLDHARKRLAQCEQGSQEESTWSCDAGHHCDMFDAINSHFACSHTEWGDRCGRPIQECRQVVHGVDTELNDIKAMMRSVLYIPEVNPMKVLHWRKYLS